MATRLLVVVDTIDYISPVLAHLYWLPVASWIKFKVLAPSYKALHGLGPCFLVEHLFPRSSTHSTRSTQAMPLQMVTPKETKKTSCRSQAAELVPILWTIPWLNYVYPPPFLHITDSWKQCCLVMTLMAASYDSLCYSTPCNSVPFFETLLYLICPSYFFTLFFGLLFVWVCAFSLLATQNSAYALMGWYRNE